MKRLTVAVLLLCTLPIILSFSPHQGSEAGPGNIQTPQVVKLTETGGAYWPSWSPGGYRIAYFERVDLYVTQFGQDRQEPVCNLWVMDSDGSNARLLWEGEIKGYIGWPIYPPIWSCEGRFIAVDSKLFRTTMIIDCTDGSEVSGSILPADCAAPRFAPSLPYLAFSRHVTDFDVQPIVEERSIFIMDYESGEERLLRTCGFNAESEWLEQPSVWSLDEQVLRVADSWRTDKTYHFYSVDSGELLFTSDDPGGGPDYSPLFTDRSRSPSGRLKVNSPSIPDFEFSCINHGGAGTGLKIYWIGEEDSETLLLDINAHIYSFQWHPRGDILLFSAGQKSESPDMPESSDIYIAGFPN